MFFAPPPTPACQTNQDTPLMAAASAGHVCTVLALLAGGAKVNKCRRKLVSPLHLAIAAGHLPVAAALVDHGACVDAADVRITFGACTAAPGRVDNFPPPSSGRAPPTPPSPLLRNQPGRPLLQAEGRTPLRLSVDCEDLGAALLLLHHGASVDDADVRGGLTYDFAAHVSLTCLCLLHSCPPRRTWVPLPFTLDAHWATLAWWNCC
jgi:hypothetical protein